MTCEEKLKAVMELHKLGSKHHWCLGCGETYPCRTARAMGITEPTYKLGEQE